MIAGKPRHLALVVLLAAASGCHRGDRKPPPATSAPAEGTAASSASAAEPPIADPVGNIPGQIRIGAAQVHGKLRADVIGHIVRKQYPAFKLCYKAALARDPAMGGRVVVKFGVDRMGILRKSEPGQTDVRDAELVGCVVHAFEGLSFPQPADGEVQVALPITFTPAQ